jgi:hypothetical protein
MSEESFWDPHSAPRYPPPARAPRGLIAAIGAGALVLIVAGIVVVRLAGAPPTAVWLVPAASAPPASASLGLSAFLAARASA